MAKSFFASMKVYNHNLHTIILHSTRLAKLEFVPTIIIHSSLLLAKHTKQTALQGEN